MPIHLYGQRCDTGGESRQGCVIAISKLTDTAGEVQADTIDFALHCRRECRQPLVVADESFDLGLRQRRVLRIDLRVERFLRGLPLSYSFPARASGSAAADVVRATTSFASAR